MNTLDDDLIRRLRVELDSLTADVPTTPPALVPTLVVARSIGQPRRDRRRMIVLAAAMVALIAGIAGLVAVRRDDGAVGTPDTAPSSAPGVTYPAVTYPASPGAVHPTPVTPDGWDVVEWGNVRLSLPPDMSPFHVGNGCAATPSGNDLQIVCGDQSVRIHQAEQQGVATQTSNGLHVVWHTGDCTGCQTLDVFELAASITVSRNSDSPRAVLDTVGASGSWRYANEVRPQVPLDWQLVTYHGVSIRVPHDWPTVQSSDAGFDDPCKIAAQTVVLGTATCADRSLQPPIDGVRLFQAEPPLTTHAGWPEQQVSAQFDGAPSVVLEVGYGTDPSIGLAILSSFTTDVSGSTLPTYATVALQDTAYVALGESVMLGAKPMLDPRGIRTFAEVSKGPTWELDQLRFIKTEYRITRGVLIQLGTNGTVTREQYDALLNELSDVPLVVVMTVKAPKPWIAGNNEIIRSLPATHPNVVVLDWEARSAEVADHLSTSDGGIHLADDVSKAFYRDIILQALGIST